MCRDTEDRQAVICLLEKAHARTPVGRLTLQAPPTHAWPYLLQAANELRHPPRMEEQRGQADSILQHDDQRGGTHPLWKGGVRGSFRGERQGDPG